jgi:hypothetical protein
MSFDPSAMIVVSMASGPKRPDAARVIRRSPDAMDLRLGIRVVRFRANNAAIMNASWSRDYIRTADVAKIGVVAKIVDFAW